MKIYHPKKVSKFPKRASKAPTSLLPRPPQKRDVVVALSRLYCFISLNMKDKYNQSRTVLYTMAYSATSSYIASPYN